MPRTNVADRLTELAALRPNEPAVVSARGGGYDQITFAAIDADATRLAHGLAAMGVGPSKGIALLVKPGVEFVTLVFALLRSGATMVLVDAGLGKQNIVRCLEATNPDGFVGIPQAQALRVVLRRRFPKAKLNVTVGRRWFWGGETIASLRKLGAEADKSPSPLGEGDFGSPSPSFCLPHTGADDPAAIVFTSGSTGPPKGVLYRHETFVTQANEIQRQYGLRPGGVDLACFPLFGLFNVACGVTTVLPEMDFSRPAACDPVKLFRAANQWNCTQAFASPAVWDRLSRHAEQTGDSIPTMRRVFSCGAPVPAAVIERTLKMVHPEAELHTPYGATESLPVATIEAQEILGETAERTAQGAGVCVGKKFDSIDWRVIRISDEPIGTIDQTEELSTGEIGELIVRGPQVSRQYLTQEPSASAAGATNPTTARHNVLAKIVDGEHVWHRVGDVGYFDDEQRFWYCGRKSHRVVTTEGTLFTEQVEAQVNTHPLVRRSALVGVGAKGAQQACIVIEPTVAADSKEAMETILDIKALAESLLAPIPIGGVWAMPTPLPVDIRHNSKIHRESIAEWAAAKLGGRA
ncbi:fatty acid CoA ligase family protein [Posidoniimonas polymericola]|nr:fatty acid CoA ligase family protein [Posidoniimonas polymericola]